MSRPLIDVTDFSVWLAEWRDLHRAGGTGSGRFSRKPRGPLDGHTCADFAVIDYTTGPWPPAPSEHDARVTLLQGFQSLESGLFELAPAEGGSRAPERTDVYETTAYFAAALELQGARPIQPLRALDGLRTPEGMTEFLEGLDWSSPREAAGRGAGVAICFAVTGDVGPEWFERYFDWLDAAVDPETGLWQRDARGGPLEALGGAYQFYAVYDRFRRPMPYPGRVVMSVLDLQREDRLYGEDGPGWTELSAAFLVDRGFRQSGRDFKSVGEALSGLARATAERIADAPFREKLLEAPHKVAGVLSLVALLSRALPGSVKVERPLRFYADRLVFV